MDKTYKDYMADTRSATQSEGKFYAPYIAIIDDSMSDRSTLRNFIRAYYNEIPVRTYKNGAHFWDSICEGVFPVRIKAEPIHAIFIDLNMPQMCGRETLMKIRERAEFANTPIYIMSRESDPVKIQQVIDLGADDFIAKPYDMMALSMLIKKGRMPSADIQAYVA